MIPSPVTEVSDCYLTDNRQFSSDIRASYRMHSYIEINVEAAPREVSQLQDTGITHEIDCEDGDLDKTGKTDRARMQFTNLRITSPGIIEVDVKGAVNNPVQSGSPDID